MPLLGATQDAVNEEAEEKVDELKEELEKIGLADNPDVQKALQDVLDKIANGEIVTDADWDAVHTAIDEYAKKVNADTDKAKQATSAVDKAAGALEMLSEIGALLLGEGDGSGLLVINPTLTGDQCFCLPCGAVMIGGDEELGIEEGCLADVLGLPVGQGEPLEESDQAPKLVNEGILISNPEENGVAVSYQFNAQAYSMEPGYSQTLQAGRWTIEFDRGQGGERARYSLYEGTYKFGAGDQGWELYRQSYQLTIDNGENPGDFYYVLNEERYVVAAGQANTHSSEYPMVISFDRGDSGPAAYAKIADQELRLLAAINPDDGLWDLYPEQAVAVEDQQAGESEATTSRTEDSSNAATNGVARDVDRLSRIRERVRQRQAQAGNPGR